MTPRKFTEVALKIFGLYSLVEGVAKISQGISLHGFLRFFSNIELSIDYILITLILLAFGWYLFQHSTRIVNKIFDMGEPLPFSPDRHFRECHISLLSLCGAFLSIWVIPIYLSSTTVWASLLLRDSTLTQQVYTRETLWLYLVNFGGLTLFQAGIFMYLLFNSKRVTRYILKFQDSQQKEV